MKVGTLLEELSQFDYDDNLVLYFLKNDELKPCKLESVIDANYEDDEGSEHASVQYNMIENVYSAKSVVQHVQMRKLDEYLN